MICRISQYEGGEVLALMSHMILTIVFKSYRNNFYCCILEEWFKWTLNLEVWSSQSEILILTIRPWLDNHVGITQQCPQQMLVIKLQAAGDLVIASVYYWTKTGFRRICPGTRFSIESRDILFQQNPRLILHSMTKINFRKVTSPSNLTLKSAVTHKIQHSGKSQAIGWEELSISKD